MFVESWIACGHPRKVKLAGLREQTKMVVYEKLLFFMPLLSPSQIDLHYKGITLIMKKI